MNPSPAAQTVTLRPAIASDDAFLRRVYASTRERELEMVAWTEDQKAAFLNMQFDAQSLYYREAYADASFNVIELDGIAIGRLYLATWPTEVRVIDIAFLPEHRSRGLGTALMHEIITTAKANGRSVSIHVEIDNPARRLYERLGFIEIHQRGLHTFMEWRPSEQPQSPSPLSSEDLVDY